MSVLFAEDDVHKSKHIREFFSSLYSSIKITEVASVKSALNKLGVDAFDLLLLDMSLPTFDVAAGEGGGRPQGSGGMEILREIERLDYSPKVIVVTQYADFSIDGSWYLLSELRDELMVEHSDVFLGLVEFDSASSDWRGALKCIMDDFIARGGF
ncbi:response regulator [Xanthomonas sacchari]|uniref:response regulator n=1 Tax=Xanthomonas sacchari TaxID=56458 RepID=UPI00225014BB|nr:response regulator [Xanthomonas sacchari]